MPDHTTSAVAVGSAGLDGRLDRRIHRPVLVILGHALHEGAGLVREHDEVAQNVEEATLVEHTADEHFELRLVSHDLAAVDGLPGRIVLEAG